MQFFFLSNSTSFYRIQMMFLKLISTRDSSYFHAQFELLGFAEKKICCCTVLWSRKFGHREGEGEENALILVGYK